MPVFAFRATNSLGRVQKGTLTGTSPREVREMLRRQGLDVVRLDEMEVNSRSFKMPLFSKRNNLGNVATFTGELATLLSVGVPLTEALETLQRQYRGHFQNCLMQVGESLAQGKTLAASMGQRPDVFDELCTSLVEVGENTGRLDHALDCICRYKRKSLELGNQVFNALMYPAVIFTASVAVSIFLMSVVVPMLLANLDDLGKQLPWPTRTLKWCSELLTGHWVWLLAGAVLVVVSLVAGLRTHRGRRFKDQVVMKLPLIGMMARKQEISRLALVMSTLLTSGLDFLKSIEIARRTTRNTLLADALESVEEMVRSGRDLGPIMRQQEFFTPMVAHVFTIGQKSGKLDSMLLRLSEDYDQQVTMLASRISVLIEPVMILFLSVGVGFILFATLLPILEAGNVL